MSLTEIDSPLPSRRTGPTDQGRLFVARADRRLAVGQIDAQLVPGMRVDTFPLTGLQDNLLHEHAVVLENDLSWNIGIVLLVFDVPLLSCQAVPAHRFDVVLRDAESGGVLVLEAELRLGVTLPARARSASISGVYACPPTASATRMTVAATSGFMRRSLNEMRV